MKPDLVDTCMVRAANTEIGIPYSQSVIACGNERRGRREQEWQVLPCITLIQLLVIERGVVVSDLRYRRVNDYFVQLTNEGKGVGVGKCNTRGSYVSRQKD